MKLLITGAWREAEKYIPKLESLGHEVAFLQYEADSLPCAPEWAEGVICNGLLLHHDVRAFMSLRYVQLTSAGLDRVPADYLHQKGVVINNARGVYSVPMAEHALSAVLNIYRHNIRFFNNQKKRVWEKDRSVRELCGSAVCVLGCGSVGTECAKRFAAMGCKVYGVDIQSCKREHFSKVFHIDDLYLAVSAADIVIFTLPLTQQTEGMADRRFFSKLKPGCVLVNIARGKIINTGDLIEALRQNELYAALDVFEEEPLDKNSPLWSMENVMITPHNSFVSDKTANRLSELIMERLNDFSGGKHD